MKNIAPKEVSVVQSPRQVCGARYTVCGKFLFAGSYENLLYRWDATGTELKPLAPLTGHQGWVQSVACSPDQKHLLSADSFGELRCWDYSRAEPKVVWAHKQAHDGWVRDIAITSDGKQIATCGRDRRICLWSADGKLMAKWKEHPEDIYSIAFHPDGKAIVSGDLKGRVQHHETATGKLIRAFDASVLYKLHRLQDIGGARCLRFNETGTVMACAGTTPKSGGNVQGMPTVLLFDWAKGTLLHTLTVGTTADGYVFDLHIRKDGTVMAVTSGNPGTGKFFLMRPGEKKPYFLHTKIANCHSLALHPNGTQFLIAGTNRGSNGNGRRLSKDKEYKGNTSPLHLWEF